MKTLTLIRLGAVGAFPADPDGRTIFMRECALCHNGAPDSRAPAREILAQRSPEAIMSALTAGSMRPQGSRITGLERRAVAEFLSGKQLSGDLTGSTTGKCAVQTPALRATPGAGDAAQRAPEWTSWGGSLTNTHFQ